MDTTLFLGMGPLEIGLIIIDIAVVIVVLIYQSRFFKETKRKIGQLENFFPIVTNLAIKQTSITKEILSSKKKLEDFIANPPARHIPEDASVQMKEDEESDTESFLREQIEYSDVDLIELKRGGNDTFKEVIEETNAYLCKNVGTSADYSLLQDICERKIDTLETQITNSINVPLYLGLVGTFVGIITGVFGIAFNVDDLFSSSNMTSLTSLLIGVVIAMTASAIGLGMMITNSAVNYKKALVNCDRDKNSYNDFLRRELMPVLSNSVASSLNSLKSVLGNFIGKFGHNLDAYANSADLLNDNIEKQHLLLVEINKMNQTQVATEIASTFSKLKNASDSLNVFQTYQDDLNETVQKVDGAISKINGVITSFEDFAKALKVVVANQGVASELQNQFKTAIEQNFPTGADARVMWRKQFDELTTDASTVSAELNAQLRASTEYIKNFADNNKDAFASLSQLKDVLNSLIEYANVQAICYKDLKQEILELKKAEVESRTNSAKLNSDLLTAVKEMTSAVKTLKNQ